MAVGATIVEYFIERFLFPSMKGIWIITFVGFLVALMGQVMRTLSMYTAGSNFNHHIQEEKKDDHKLVTFGVYQYELGIDFALISIGI
jgi:protein-S-isoprenylcysteine O-methyltransferase